jgi:hypothetical protein
MAGIVGKWCQFPSGTARIKSCANGDTRFSAFAHRWERVVDFGVAVTVGAWFLAKRHGDLRRFVSATKDAKKS